MLSYVKSISLWQFWRVIYQKMSVKAQKLIRGFRGGWRNEQKICMPNTLEDDDNKLCTKLGRSMRYGTRQQHETTEQDKTQNINQIFSLEGRERTNPKFWCKTPRIMIRRRYKPIVFELRQRENGESMKPKTCKNNPKNPNVLFFWRGKWTNFSLFQKYMEKAFREPCTDIWLTNDNRSFWNRVRT